MSNSDMYNIKFNKVQAERAALVNNAVAGAVKANQSMHVSGAEIQKRGFTYNGDSHKGWGFGGANVTGLNGAGPPYFGRNPAGNGMVFQPFGIGANGLITNGLQPSIFSTTGAGVKFSKTTKIAHLKMAMAVEAYKGFGIVKNVIDLMCNFASEGLKIQHPKPAIQRFYQRWAELCGLQSRVKDILRYYYKYGNVFVYTTMGIVDPEALRQMKSVRGSTSLKLNALKSDDYNDPYMSQRRRDIKRELRKSPEERLIPWRYTLLNPFQMDRYGSKFFGESKWAFIMDEDTYKEMSSKTMRAGEGTDILDETDVNLPPEFKRKIKEDRVVELDQTRLCTLHYMKDDHEDWADPMVWPVMNDIMYKNQLRAMDMSVVNSTINATTIYKLGKIEEGYVAPESHYTQFANMLRTPTYSHNIVWNDAIEMESNYPPIEKILGSEKYKSVDKDILAGLGVPGILVDGNTGGSYSNAFLQVRTLLEKLEEGRLEVINWVNKQLRIIATTMGHQQVPTIKFGQMSLRDEQAEKQLIIQLIDRGIISVEDVHEVFGIDTVQTLERIKRENKLAEEGVLVQHGPYKEPMTDMLQEELMDMEFDHDSKQQDKQLTMQEKLKKEEKKARMQQQRQQQKQNVKPNGRPAPSKGIPQEKKRDTKPQGMGSVIEYERLRTLATSAYTDVSDMVTEKMINLKGVKNKKSLSKEDREDLQEIIFVIFTNVDLDEGVDEIFINEQLGNLKVNRVVSSYVKELGKPKNLAEKKQFSVIGLTRYHLGE